METLRLEDYYEEFLIVAKNADSNDGHIPLGAFLWDDPDQDQWSEISRIMVDQMNPWILVQNGLIGSFDLPWSEWSRITDPDPDHPKGTHTLSIGMQTSDMRSLRSLHTLYVVPVDQNKNQRIE